MHKIDLYFGDMFAGSSCYATIFIKKAEEKNIFARKYVFSPIQ